jgi:hypothetical protein
VENMSEEELKEIFRKYLRLAMELTEEVKKFGSKLETTDADYETMGKVVAEVLIEENIDFQNADYIISGIRSVSPVLADIVLRLYMEGTVKPNKEKKREN